MLSTFTVSCYSYQFSLLQWLSRNLNARLTTYVSDVYTVTSKVTSRYCISRQRGRSYAKVRAHQKIGGIQLGMTYVVKYMDTEMTERVFVLATQYVDDDISIIKHEDSN